MSRRIDRWREALVALCRTRALTLLGLAAVLLFFVVGTEVRVIRRTEPDIFSPKQILVHPKAITYSDSRLTLHVIMPAIAPRPGTGWRSVARAASALLNETLIRNVTVHIVTDVYDEEPDPERRSAAVGAATLRHPRLHFEVYRLCDLVVEAATGASTCGKAPQPLPGARAFSRLLRILATAWPDAKRSVLAAGILGPYAHLWLGAADATRESGARVAPAVALFLDPAGLRAAGDAWEIVTGHIPRMHDSGALVALAAEERAGGPGGASVLSGSVQLLDLSSLRLSPDYSGWLARLNASGAPTPASRGSWGVASFVFSRLRADHPDWVHVLGCEWNRQARCVRAPAPAPAADAAELVRDLCPRSVRFLYSPDVWRADVLGGEGDAAAAAVAAAGGGVVGLGAPGCTALASAAGGASTGPQLAAAHAAFEAAAIAALPSLSALDAVQADRQAALWALSAAFERRGNLTASGVRV